MNDTLAQRISGRTYNEAKGWHDRDKTLSQAEQDSIVALLGSRCRSHTITSLRRAVAHVADLDNFGIYERVVLKDGKASYCAGQSYPDEIRTVRNLLTKGTTY